MNKWQGITDIEHMFKIKFLNLPGTYKYSNLDKTVATQSKF